MRLLRFGLRTVVFSALSVALSLFSWWLFKRLSKPSA